MLSAKSFKNLSITCIVLSFIFITIWCCNGNLSFNQQYIEPSQKLINYQRIKHFHHVAIVFGILAVIFAVLKRHVSLKQGHPLKIMFNKSFNTGLILGVIGSFLTFVSLKSIKNTRMLRVFQIVLLNGAALLLLFTPAFGNEMFGISQGTNMHYHPSRKQREASNKAASHSRSSVSSSISS